MQRGVFASLLVLAALGAPGCRSEEEEASANGVALAEVEHGFATKLTKLTTLPESASELPATFDLPPWRRFAIRPESRYEPMFVGSADLALVDVEKQALRELGKLEVAIEDTGSGRRPRLAHSADLRWMAFQRGTGRAPVLVLRSGDEPSAAFEVGAASKFAWVGNDTLVLEDGASVHLFDVAKRSALVEVDVSGPGGPQLTATPAGDRVLVFSATDATLVRSSDGATTRIAGWNVVPAPSKDAPPRTTSQTPSVIASPAGNGFAVIREGAAGGDRSIAFLDLDGALSVLAPAARADVAFGPDGALAYVRPAAAAGASPEDVDVVVHRAGQDDVVLSGASGYETSLRFSDDGERIAVSGGRFVGRTTESGVLGLLDLGDATNAVGQVSHTPRLDRAFVQLYKQGSPEGPSPLPGKLVRVDLATRNATPVMALKELPRNMAVRDFFWMAVEPDAAEPTLYVKANWARRLVEASGKVICMLPDASEELGWSGGVFYYVQEVRKEGAPLRFQLRGVSRDCKVDALIGDAADEMLVQSAPDRSDGYRETQPLHVLFRAGRDVFAFTPSPYRAPSAPEAPAKTDTEAPGEGASSVPEAPPSPAPTQIGASRDSAPGESAGASESDEETPSDDSGRRSSSGGCATSPGGRAPASAIALTVLGLAITARRRRSRG